MNTNTITMISLGAAVVIAFLIMILIQKKVIKRETLEDIVEMIEKMPVTMGSGLFGKIYEYSRTAVLTVEQLVKTGEIKPDDASRKDAAMRFVERAAKVDDVPFGAAESEAASICIEANVHELPRNQQKVTGDAGAAQTG